MEQPPVDLHALVLQCVKTANRPLRLLELADAISTSGVLGATVTLASAKEDVRKACTYPVQLSDDDTIELIEPTVADSTPSAAEGHLQLARLCVSHVALGYSNDFKSHFDSLVLDSFNRKTDRSHAFASYAVENCLDHVKQTVSCIQKENLTELYDELDRTLALPNAVALLFIAYQRKEQRARDAAQGHPAATNLGVIRATRRSSDHSNDRLNTPIELATCLGLVDYSRRIFETQKPELPEGLFSRLCLTGDVEMVSLLLAHGANIEDRDKNGLGPLHYAVREHRFEIFSVLMDAGADLLGESRCSRRMITDHKNTVTPLDIAGGANQDMLKQFLRYVEEPERLTSLLIRAVKARNVEGVTTILEDIRVDVNAHEDPDHQSRTPLYHACALRDTKMMACLLNVGASTQPPNGKSTWDQENVACWPAHVPLLVYIPPLHAYANGGDLIIHPWREIEHHGQGVIGSRTLPFSDEGFDLLLAHGASVDQRDSRQNTALHHASDPDAVRYLIEAGVDYNAVNDQGRSFFSAPADDRPSISLIVEPVLAGLELVGREADLTTRDFKTGRTPLLSWLLNGVFEVALHMLGLGADATATDVDGNGAFHLAVKNRPKFQNWKDGTDSKETSPTRPHSHTDLKAITQALARQGVDVALVNKKKQNALHTAMEAEGFFETEGPGSRFSAQDKSADVRGRTSIYYFLINSKGKDAAEVCKTMVSTGARINIVDIDGRPLLFESIWSSDLLRCLVELGGDQHAVDKEGNTLWHEAASQGYLLYELSDTLKSLGLNPAQSNTRGQTPLHYASWIYPSNFSGGKEPVLKDCPLQDLLKENVDVDVSDENGITPLHVAIAGHEYAVQVLLAAGADASKTTNDGVTTLQIAAASIKGNTLGMLLQNLERVKGNGFVSDFVNRRNTLGRTALYYACASGRLDTVQKLIGVGASVQSDDFEGSCWDGCSMFEGPEHIPYPTVEDIENETKFSTSRLKARNLRSRHRSRRDSLRIDDILPLLRSYDIPGPHLWDAMERAAQRGDGYVLDLLRCGIGDYLLTGKMQQTLQERKEYIETKPKQSREQHDGTLIDLLRTKDDVGLERWARNRDLVALNSTNHGERILRCLIDAGNWALLKDITWAAPEVLTQVELEVLKAVPSRDNKSLLALACESSLPNIGMIRFLVEALKAGFATLGETDKLSSSMCAAVHVCIGQGYWWHLYEALPYLVEQGADINAIDHKGSPALFAKFKRYTDYDLDGLKHVLNLGYDPNIPSREYLHMSGFTLLDSCGNNKDMVKLLMSYGAIVTQNDLSCAIHSGNTARLRAMLANGADPNTRYQRPEMVDYRATIRPSGRGRNKGEEHVSTRDMFPLQDAVTEIHRGEEAVALLLEHGADPNLRYESQSIMHAIIRRDKNPGQLLDFDGLNLEDRDFEGATLLLVACQKASDDIVNKLLDLGADVHAKDNRGRTALHRAQGRLAITRRIAGAIPELTDQADQEGKTPLHLALQKDIWDATYGRNSPSNDEVAIFLLEQGASPLVKAVNGDSAMHMLFTSPWDLSRGETLLSDNRQKLLDILLAAGLSVNARNANGETPIFGFLRGKLSKTIRSRELSLDEGLDAQLLAFLENLGVDFTAVADDGKTLLHLTAEARDKRRLSRFKFFMKKGLSPKAEDGSKQTPLDVAVRVKNKDILEWYQAQRFEGEPNSTEWVVV